MLFQEVNCVLCSSTSLFFLLLFWFVFLPLSLALSGKGAQSNICIQILLTVKEIRGRAAANICSWKFISRLFGLFICIQFNSVSF